MGYTDIEGALTQPGCQITKSFKFHDESNTAKSVPEKMDLQIFIIWLDLFLYNTFRLAFHLKH